MTNKLPPLFTSLARSLNPYTTRTVIHTSPVLQNLYKAADPSLNSVTNPFLYTEFDVGHHNQALGRPPVPILGSNVFSLPSPNPLFSLIPAEYSATMNLKKISDDLNIDLSTVKLREHFVQFHEALPGSGTLICNTSLRELATSYQHVERGRALLVVEVELWSTEADLSAMDLLTFNQFCFSCVQRGKKENIKKSFPTALKKLEWPLPDSVSTSNCSVSPDKNQLQFLSKIGRENKCPSNNHIFNLLSWRQEQLEGVGVITFVTNNICQELEINFNKVAAIKTGLSEAVSEGEVVETNIWTEDHSEDQYKVFFDSTELKTGKPVIQGAYLLVNK